MNEEEIYTFNEYILVYEKGNNDRSCLTISKIINDDMYVMSSLYDGSADVISMILDNLQQENKKLKEQYCERTDCSGRLGNSKKVEELEQENQNLKENNLAMQEEMARTWAKLDKKEDIINKAKDLIESYYDFMEEKYDFKYFDGYKLLEILDNKG